MPGLETKKGWSQYRLRIRNPGLYSTMRTLDIGGGVSKIRGKNKKTGKWETQALRFDKSVFKSAQQVRDWLKAHPSART